jgi:hypothetical protein
VGESGGGQVKAGNRKRIVPVLTIICEAFSRQPTATRGDPARCRKNRLWTNIAATKLFTQSAGVVTIGLGDPEAGRGQVRRVPFGSRVEKWKVQEGLRRIASSKHVQRIESTEARARGMRDRVVRQ